MRGVVFTCESCGRMFEGSASGSHVCPSCQTVSIAPAFVLDPEPAPPRRWWEDPIVIVGALIPAAILAAFAWHQWPAPRPAPRVAAAKADRRPASVPEPVDLERLEADALRAFSLMADRLETDRSPAAFALFDRADETLKRVRRAIWAPRRALLDEAARHFAEPPDEIGGIARDTARRMGKAGLPTDPVELVEGGVFLLRNSHHSPGPGEERPSFRGYTTLYEMWRKDGLDHGRAVAKMHELRKF